MSATFISSQPPGNIQAGITDQSNNIVIFDFDLSTAFPGGLSNDYTYFVGYYLTTTQPNSNNFMGYYVTTSGQGVVWGQYNGPMKPLEQFNENIPAQAGTQQIWFDFDFPGNSVSVGVNSPIGDNGVSVPIPGDFRGIGSFHLPEISIGRFQGKDIQTALEQFYSNGSGVEGSKVPVTNVYLGNFLQLTCLGLTNQAPTSQGCLGAMQAFCQANPKHPKCACLTAISQAGPNPIPVPYECYLEDCKKEESYVPPVNCPPVNINICEQVIEAGKSHQIVRNSGLYQQCCQGSPTCGPEPSKFPIEWVILGVLILGFLLILLRSKRKK